MGQVTKRLPSPLLPWNCYRKRILGLWSRNWPSTSNLCCGHLLLCTVRGLSMTSVWMLQWCKVCRPRAVCCDYTTSILWKLHWLPICLWSQFKVLDMSIKAYNSLGSGQLKDWTSHRCAFLCALALLPVPLASKAQRASCRSRAFSVVAPNLYHAIEVQFALSLSHERDGWLWVYCHGFVRDWACWAAF